MLKRLELIRKKQRVTSKYLDSIHTKDASSGFEHLVPGLSNVAERRNRRYKNSQPDINDEEDLSELMELSDDETIDWAEE